MVGHICILTAIMLFVLTVIALLLSYTSEVVAARVAALMPYLVTTTLVCVIITSVVFRTWWISFYDTLLP